MRLLIGVIVFLPLHILSRASFLGEKIASNEANEIVNEHFLAASKIFFEKKNPWMISFVGASPDQLDRTKPLLKSIPHFVAKDEKKLCASGNLAENSFIIYFLSSLRFEYATKVVESLINCTKVNVIFMFEGAGVIDPDIEFVLRMAFERVTRTPMLIYYGGKSVKLYGYGVTEGCSNGVLLLLDWYPGVNMTKIDSWLVNYSREVCPVVLGVENSLPFMDLEEDVNGKLSIVGGSEGYAISTIAEKMGFTPLVQRFRVVEESYHRKAIIESCIAGNTTIGISEVRLTQRTIRDVDVSITYNIDCVVWCVPKFSQWNIGNIVISEFSWPTWVFVGLMFLASFVVEKIIRNTWSVRRGKPQRSESSRIILDIVGTTLGIPSIHQPLSIGGKVLLVIYLFYSTVITTAYKTSLASLLAIANVEQPIVDLEGIVKANLTTGGDMSRLVILKDQIGENEMIPEIIKRYVIESDVEKALRRVSIEKDFALLISYRNLIYHSELLAQAGEPMSFHLLEGCFLTYSNVMVFPRKSRFVKPVDRSIRQLDEGGLLMYGKAKPRILKEDGTIRTLARMEIHEEFRKFTRNKFHSVFIIYCFAMAFCVIVFLGELIFRRFKSPGEVQRFRNSQGREIGRRIPLRPISLQSN